MVVELVEAKSLSQSEQSEGKAQRVQDLRGDDNG